MAAVVGTVEEKRNQRTLFFDSSSVDGMRLGAEVIPVGDESLIDRFQLGD